MGLKGRKQARLQAPELLDMGSVPFRSAAQRCVDRLIGREEKRILIVGLDAAGKTTTLYKLKLGEIVTTIPTIGFNVETIDYKHVSFTAWDIGGRGNMRALVRHYYQGTHAVVLVVDSNDR